MSLPSRTDSLAIVVPVFKILYFEEMLNSLGRQTCKDFNVYIGDDCSPNDFESIVLRRNDLKIKFKRFPSNLGKRNLVQQWERCISLTEGEKWVWLFSDDDVMDPNCVENFFKALAVTSRSHNVYKFNSAVIDGSGQIVEKPKSMPAVINPYELISKKITGEIKTYVTDYIFSRNIYEKTGGFVNFPLAWGADDATWVKFSEDKGIYVIPDSLVYWRLSQINISNPGFKGAQEKSLALIKYCRWIINHFRDHPEIDLLKEKLQHFFFGQMRFYNVKITPWFFLKIMKPLKELWNLNPKAVFVRLFKY